MLLFKSIFSTISVNAGWCQNIPWSSRFSICLNGVGKGDCFNSTWRVLLRLVVSQLFIALVLIAFWGRRKVTRTQIEKWRKKKILNSWRVMLRVRRRLCSWCCESTRGIPLWIWVKLWSLPLIPLDDAIFALQVSRESCGNDSNTLLIISELKFVAFRWHKSVGYFHLSRSGNKLGQQCENGSSSNIDLWDGVKRMSEGFGCGWQSVVNYVRMIIASINQDFCFLLVHQETSSHPHRRRRKASSRAFGRSHDITRSSRTKRCTLERKSRQNDTADINPMEIENLIRIERKEMEMMFLFRS